MTEGKKYEPGGERFVEGRAKKLAYNKEIKDLIRENPGILKSVLGLIEELEDKSHGTSASFGEITVTKLKLYGYDDVYSRHHYKVDVESRAFFLKKVDCFEADYIARGFDQAMSTKNAKELLKDLSWARVVDFELGYQDKNHSYYVSKWEGSPEIQDLDVYLGELYDETYGGYLSEEKKAELQKRYDELMDKSQTLQRRLKGYFDVFAANMFYDPQSRQILLFDLSIPMSQA